jgi:hypothetical protein
MRHLLMAALLGLTPVDARAATFCGEASIALETHGSQPSDELIRMVRAKCPFGSTIQIPVVETAVIGTICDFGRSMVSIPGDRGIICSVSRW